MGFLDDRARERDALLLATRELRRPASQQLGETGAFRRLAHAAIDFVGGRVAGAKRKRDVVEDGEMRIERVVLEHHRDVAGGRLEAVDPAIADPDRAGVELFEPRNEAQQRRLAAAGRPQQDEALAAFNFEIDAVDRRVRAEPFADVLESNAHGRRSILRTYDPI